MRAVRGRRLAGALALPLALAAAAALAVALAVEDVPRVARPPPLSAGDVAAGVRAVQQWALARVLPQDAAAAPSQLLLPQHAAEWLLDQAANRGRPSATRLELRPGAALVRASVAVPANAFLGGWLNVEAVLKDGAGLPAVERLRVGRLPLPGWAGDLALRRLAARLDARLAAGSEGAAALHVLGRTVRGLAFGAGEVRVAYEWDDGVRDRLVAALLPPARQQRARAYHERLAGLAAAAGPRRDVSLARLIGPMFALAQARSRAGAPAAENRAALQTLALYAVGTAWTAFLPAAGDWPALPRLAVTLAGRDDFPQHWLVSAAIAAEGGGPLADAIGLYKELGDTRRGGSGFSFTDLAADRAGTLVGLRAVEAPAALQARLAAGVEERDLIPEVADLPEFMSAAEFARRYGAVGSPAYRRVLAAIEARVAALPALR